MRRLMIASGIALALAAPALADTRAVLVHGTLMLTDTTGDMKHFLLAEDGSYEQSSMGGDATPGTWELKDERLCLTPAGQAAMCLPMAADHKVGDHWAINGPTGAPVYDAVLVGGRVSLAH